MKKFDKAAAMRGARVCTRDGVHRVFLDFSDGSAASNGTTFYPFFGYILDNGSGTFKTAYFTEDGICKVKDKSNRFDLVMADDDYLEKLERGEYSAPEQIAAQPFSSPADESYWRKMYTGMAMQGLMADWEYKKRSVLTGNSDLVKDTACYSVECADALIEELKKEKQ